MAPRQTPGQIRSGPKRSVPQLDRCGMAEGGGDSWKAKARKGKPDQAGQASSKKA